MMLYFFRFYLLGLAIYAVKTSIISIVLSQDDLSNDIESLLEEVRNVQTRLSDLPDDSLHAMEDGLKDGIAVLVKCEEAANLLETKIMEYRQEEEIQVLLKELIIMKARISKLLTQARQGLEIIQVSKDAKVEMARQTKEIEENKDKILKLDRWLELINNELKGSTQQSDVLTEADIIKYIEIYEKYIREYEEYEVVLKSITVISNDESSQSLREKLNAMQRALEETKNLVIVEIERLRHVLLQIKSAPELVEDDISQTDRTIDSTSMPEEVVTPREVQIIKEKELSFIEEKPSTEQIKIKEMPIAKDADKVQEKLQHTTIETQTGKSLMTEPPPVADKSVICEPEIVETRDVSITCAPPKEVEIQTSEPHSSGDHEVLESIQVRQIITDGQETIEIASRPVMGEQKLDEHSLFVDANYRDDRLNKDSQLNIIHSLPQSFETVMVEPDETTTEVVVDADGTKRIIVKKIRKTLVTRQQAVLSQHQRSEILSGESLPHKTFSQVTLREDKGSTSTTLDDGGIQHIQYRSHDGQIISGLPSGEVTIQEFTSKPDLIIKMEKDMKPEDIMQLAEGQTLPQIQTSSSSVTAVVQQVTKRIVKTRRRIIRRVVIIDGKEHITEEVIEEPDNIEVFEEEIPRVSINVTEKGGVQFEEIDDSDDKDDHPSLHSKPDEKSSQQDKPDDQDESESPKKSPEVTVVGQATDTQNKTKSFVLKESNQLTEVSHEPDIIDKKSEDVESDLANIGLTLNAPHNILNPQENIIAGLQIGQHLITEQTSKVSTIVQKVTKKITRMRKRIIKHIQIIDGKEHITEEVIEEPVDIEIIEGEPSIIHNVQDQGAKSKIIKVIRQIQIIDGKEHVTEKTIEEADDDFGQTEDNSEAVMTTDIEVDKTEIEDPENKQLTLGSQKKQQLENIKISTQKEDAINIGHSKTTPDQTEISIQEETGKSKTISLIDASKFLIVSEVMHSENLSPTSNKVEQICEKTTHEQSPQEKLKTSVGISPTETEKASSMDLTVISKTTPEAQSSDYIQKDLTKDELAPNQTNDDNVQNIVKVEFDTPIEPVNIITKPNETEENVEQPLVGRQTISDDKFEVVTPYSFKEPLTQAKTFEQLQKDLNKDESALKQTVDGNIINVDKPVIDMRKESDTTATIITALDPKNTVELKHSTKEEPLSVIDVPEITSHQNQQEIGSKSPNDRHDVISIMKNTLKSSDELGQSCAVEEPINIHKVVETPDINIEQPHQLLEKSKYQDSTSKTYDITSLLESERQHTELHGVKCIEIKSEISESNKTDDSNDSTQSIQSVNVTLPISEINTLLEQEPKSKLDIECKTINVDSPVIAEKEIDVDMPSDVKFTASNTFVSRDNAENKIIDTQLDQPIKKSVTENVPLESGLAIAKENYKLVEPDPTLINQPVSQECPLQSAKVMTDVLESVNPKAIIEKDDNNLLLDSERQHFESLSDNYMSTKPEYIKTEIGQIKTTKTELEQPLQSSNMSTSITKTEVLSKPEPKMKDEIINENVDIDLPVIIKKDIEVVLPTEIKTSDKDKELFEPESQDITVVSTDTCEKEISLERPPSPKYDMTESPIDKLKSETDNQQDGKIKPETSSAQSQIFISQRSVHVGQSDEGTIMVESSVRSDSLVPETSYIPTISYPKSIEPAEPLEVLDKTEPTSSKDKTYDVNLMLQSERQHTELHDVKNTNVSSKGTKDKPNVVDVSIMSTQQPEQSLEISTCIIKTDDVSKVDPQVKLDVKIENIESNEPLLIKKEIEVVLPSNIKITEHKDLEVDDKIEKEKTLDQTDNSQIDIVKIHKGISNLPEKIDIVEKLDASSQVTPEKSDLDILHVEDVTQASQQSLEILMSLSKLDELKELEPSMKFSVKIEDLQSNEPQVVNKDMAITLPSDIQIVNKEIGISLDEEKQPLHEPIKEVIDKVSPDVSTTDRKKSKKRKNKKGSDSDSVNAEIPIETDKSLTETDSSSLDHYIQLPSSPPIESPKPTESIIKTTDLHEMEYGSPLDDSETIIEEMGYEPEETSVEPIKSSDKKKKQKKHKQRGVSEVTTYPKLSTTDSDQTTVSSPVEFAVTVPQKKVKDKKRKRKTAVVLEPEEISETIQEPEVEPSPPKLGSEVIDSSPRDESYHTMSEVSDVSTVKIIEECIQSSPENLQKEVSTTVTYPVPVVEEIPTQDYSVQTSPEILFEAKVEDDMEKDRPAAVDIVQQTSPISVSESLVQTTPVEEKEVHTQTLDNITVVEKVLRSETEMQTSRTATPEPIILTESTTQVIPQDISVPEEKYSQTSSPVEESKEEITNEIIINTESREMQTSPLPVAQKDEKSTEITIETVETDIQTMGQENVDQQTSTSPGKETEMSEISVQTTKIPLTSSFTQFDDQQNDETDIEKIHQFELPEKRIASTSQQTSPRDDVTIQLTALKPEIETLDMSQQTSPRDALELSSTPVLDEKPVAIKSESLIHVIQGELIPTTIVEDVKSVSESIPEIDDSVPTLKFELTKQITIDNSQQTSPRVEDPVVVQESLQKLVDKNIVTVDSTQQTSPRMYSEDSISTSTDEPYEVHLRAHISIPHATSDFIESERQYEDQPATGEKHKQKKKKQKRKAEPLLPQSPESLSDPITTEWSVSVTPTSEDISMKNSSSIDEGIYHLTSPTTPNHDSTAFVQHKPTYSDVVQRAKSKSPSPSKIILPLRNVKERLQDSIEKRALSVSEKQKAIPENAMVVALYEPSVEKSYDLVVHKKLDEVKNAIQSNDSSKIENNIIIIIETISIWLEEIQLKIQRETIAGNKEINENEHLSLLHKHINNLKEIVEVTEINEEIITLIETLIHQINAVECFNKQSSVKMHELEEEWTKFVEDTERLNHRVDCVKSSLDEVILSDVPTQQKLESLDKIELENTDNSDTINKLFRRYRTLVEVNPKRECPILLYSCDDDTKQVENAVNTERDRLMQLTSLAEEYEQTLQDFAQITEVAEALLDGKIIVTNLDHLHEEIQKHRKFFVNLSHCRAILESLEDNLDSETRAKYSALHNSLHDRATLIIDRAASRAQQMTLAASRWTLLEQGMKEEKQWLIVAQQRVPDLSNVTSMDHEQYINLYQSISLDISHHYAKMLRLLSITEGLQNLIVCSGLETECSSALDTLLRLQEEVDSRLTRLTAFKENWLTYDHLIDRIEGWMKTANRELENVTPENITSTGNLRRFWELKAQHEVYTNLKNESGIQFEKALEILPISDEMVQRQFFSNVEDKWQDLATRIDDIHSTAIQNISDRDVSSAEKLNIIEEELRELRASLDCLKSVIRSEDELNLYIERLQVMTSRIDRILNELSRLSLLPTAESERLGALLTQSGILDDQISEELERSLLLKEKIVQVQTGIIRCQKSQRRARLTLEECEAAECLGSDVVERASETCDRLLEDLSSQWRDILALRQSLHTLPTSLRVCVSPTGIEKDISALQEIHAELEAACNDLSRRLRTKVQLWRRFERQLEMVQGAVREADYMVELLTVQGQVDYDRLLKATEKLETLSESLTRRSGELVGELRDAAAPLAATTEPTVASQLKRELDDAAAAYEHTCTNLTQLCDKYHKAVDLWKRYRDAAAAVRAFAEFQEGRLHALRPNEAPATAAACLEQESRVAELRSLAAQVAAETGSRALQADADALARRLQLVAGAVQALADLGEARQLARAKAQHAKKTFCDMKQDLALVHEDGEIVEDKLIALRDNLIALGKSEADIVPAKAELPDIDRDVSDEHSIVRILELWQAMFRDTFLHYHRLSTALVRSGDAATALRLWHEYLLDLQSFLSGSVPADYENLTEHRRLCRVHRNLLTSQRSVLMNENKEMKNRDLADKFDTLTNLHNETLARIVERQDEVCTRIAAWDDYREINTELLRWLKEMEREKEKLQLRYVHIKRINKVLGKIQNLSDKIPEGRKQTEKLLINLKKVLEFTEEAYGASVRIEYAGIVKRVDNLQASLDTWRDFLSRILALVGEYESLTTDLNKIYSKTQDEINSYNDEERLSRPQLKKLIEKYTELRTKIEKTEIQIEALSVIQEQLKECLSPQDIRIVNQKLWQLRQQRADLEHQLSIIIHRLQERIEIYTVYESRLTRFSEWLITLESRLESSNQSSEISALDPQDLIRRITSDIQAETVMKEREFEWLTLTGTNLIELSKKDEKAYSKNTSKQLKDVQERWNKVQETGRNRIAKITELLDTISQLEERLTEIRTKLHTIESRLTAPIVLEHLTTRAVDDRSQERDDIHKSIENESGEVGEALNLCLLVFNDSDVLKGNFDLRNLRTGYDIVEKKWKSICDASEQRKSVLREVRKSAELANSLLPKVEKKLDSIEKRVEKIEIRKQRGEPEDESVSKAVIKDLEALEADVKQLEDSYSRLASARGLELRGDGADTAARLRAAVRRWQQLRGRVDAAGADIHRQFVAAHGRAVVALAEADVRLTRALHLAPTPLDKTATLKELAGVEKELVECEALVSEADRLALGTTSEGVSDMVAEYRALYADVVMRLHLARAEVVSDVDTGVQVDTLKWETDAALQVDTLTSKETYHAELASAVKEASESLEALRTALLQEPRENASGDELATAAKDIAKAGAKPSQTLELAKHLSELLLTECDATEDEAMLKEVESLSLRYEDLLAQAKKRELQINNMRLPHTASYALTCEHEPGRLTCPLCSERNWKQLDNDLWRLEQWLQFAEATDAARIDPPEQYDALEDAIQDHREFLLDLDSHKSIVVSLNVVGTHVAAHAAEAQAGAAAKVLARRAAANKRWDDACARAAAWQGRLQRALVHNTQFHDIVVELVAQLSNAERGVRSREPLRLSRPAEALQRDFRRFSELRDELAAAEPRVLALHDAAQLLRSGDAPPHSDDICRRLGELRLRLQSLRKLSAVYALKLGAALARRPTATSALAAAAAAVAPQLMEEEEEQISTMTLPPLDESDVVLNEESEEQEIGRLQRGLRFVSRVARASLPFQALLLLLLGAAALAPHAHSGCRDAGPGFEPVLRYPDGPPPL